MVNHKNSFLKNYRPSILLISGLLAGGVLGAVLGENARVLQPIGTLFLNLVFVLVVPLVFFSVARSMISMHRSGVIGKMLGTVICVFLLMSLVAGIFSYGFMSLWNPFAGITRYPGEAVQSGGGFSGDLNLGDTLVNAFTVSDFSLLLSREHLLPLFVFAALFGLAVSFLDKNAGAVRTLIEEGETVIMKMMEIIMKLAPIGLGCYFADIVSRLGSQIVGEYMEIFLVVSAACAICYIVFYSLFALYSHIPLGKFWKEMIAPSATAVGTCSSAACMPVTMAAAKNLGVSDTVAEGVIPLGTNLHKDGSIITSVAKVLFTLYFFGMATGDFRMAILVIAIAVFESIVVGAIPVGGMTGEIFICAILGLDPSFAATLLIIGTICDIPATLLNATGNLVAATLVNRLVK